MSHAYRKRLYETYFRGSYSVVNHADDKAYRDAAHNLSRMLLPLLPDDRRAGILDVGCGIGYALSMLIEHGYRNVLGVDLSAEQVGVAQGRGLPAEQRDAFETLSHCEERYHVILALDLVEHLTKNELLQFLDLAHTALRHGGRLIIKTPNANSLVAARARYRDLTHEVIFTENSLRQAIVACGLRPVSVRGEPFLPFTLVGWMRRLLAGGVRAWWKLCIIAELGREGLGVPMAFNLLAVAERP